MQMEFWLFAAFLTIATTLAVLLPLTRRRRSVAADGHCDLEVYRDQLDELSRDAKYGLIDKQDGEQAYAEIARRILKVNRESERNKTITVQKARCLMFFAVLTIPLVSWSLYFYTGSPDLSVQLLKKRIIADQSVDELVALAETHLSKNPDDGQGWDALAPIYLRLGRAENAVNAYRKAIYFLGETASRMHGLTEALTHLETPTNDTTKNAVAGRNDSLRSGSVTTVK